MLLSACGGDARPSLYTYTGASVLVDYSEQDLLEATDTAQAYCHATGGHAQYAHSEETDEGWFSSDKKLAVFNCANSPAQARMTFGSAMPMMLPSPASYYAPQAYHGVAQPLAAVPLPLEQLEPPQDTLRVQKLTNYFPRSETKADLDDVDWDGVFAGRSL